MTSSISPWHSDVSLVSHLCSIPHIALHLSIHLPTANNGRTKWCQDRRFLETCIKHIHPVSPQWNLFPPAPGLACLTGPDGFLSQSVRKCSRQMITGPYLQKQESHSFPTRCRSSHRRGRNKAEYVKIPSAQLPFHFSSGCSCWFTSAFQNGLNSGQSLLTAPPPTLCALSLICSVSQKQTTPSPSSSFTSHLVVRAVLLKSSHMVKAPHAFRSRYRFEK